MRRILLSGYYGYHNAGDEAILRSIIDTIRKIDSDAEISVLADNVEFTEKKYGIKAVKRFQPFSILRALLHCDILISGGGTLFQDRTSTRSLIYYTGIIRLAKSLGKRVMVYANGMGPITKRSNLKRVKKAIESADMVTLRDAESMDFVRDLHVRNPKVFLTTDPVFSLDLPDLSQAEEVLDAHRIPRDRDFVVVSTRSWKREDEFIELFAKTCDYIVEHYHKNIVFVPMQYPHDLDTTNRIKRGMRNPSFVVEGLDTMQMLSLIRKSTYVLSMRLHGLIFAVQTGVPCLGFSYDPKIDRLLKQMEMPCASKIEEMCYSDMRQSVDLMEENIEVFRQKIAEKQEEIAQLSLQNLENMREFLE